MARPPVTGPAATGSPSAGAPESETGLPGIELPAPCLRWNGRDELQGTWASIVWRGATPAGVRAHAEALQRHLQPGGMLLAVAPRRPRAVARALRPYFEGGRPQPGQRFVPVAAHRSPGGAYVAAYRRGPGLHASHFDDLAHDYDDEMPAHLVDHYLHQKMRRLAAAGADGRGLEVGCGQGHYARAAAAHLGARVIATDQSARSLAAARRHGPIEAAAADALLLPFRDGAFDFAYTVNMLHHLKRGEQRVALDELARVVRPGGAVLVFEINVRNPLFRFYMRRVFPRTRRIDRGDEEFLDPRRLPLPPSLTPDETDHYTFVPDFAPRWSLRPLRAVERWLERSPARAWSIHYTVVLRRR